MLIEVSDIVRLILQFLKETSLPRTLLTLQDESRVALNTVDHVEAFIADVRQGNWESVISVVRTLQLPSPLLIDIYEQLVLELIELRELDTARQMLRSAEPLVRLRVSDETRFAKLDDLVGRPYFDARNAYASGSGKEHRRGQLAEALRDHVSAVPTSRLLALLGQALKWQQEQGQLQMGQRFDLFKGGAVERAAQAESYVTTAGPVIKFGKKSHAECSAFSPDGQYLVSGSVDGFIEVWDFDRGKTRKDLSYQASDEFMMHDEPILAVSFSRDSELLASGSQAGHIKIWRVRTGQCVRRFNSAHAQGVTCLTFSPDGTLVASGAFDAISRVHGLKSGKTLKELRGHTSYINSIAYAPDGLRLVTGSSDGYVRVWDAKTAECAGKFQLPKMANGVELSINTVAFLPNNPEHLVVSSRSPHVHVMTLAGEVVQILSSGRRDGGDFVGCAVSTKGHWIHGLAEDGQLYCFDVAEGKLQQLIKAHDKEAMVIGVVVHPHRNLVGTWADDGTMRLWR